MKAASSVGEVSQASVDRFFSCVWNSASRAILATTLVSFSITSAGVPFRATNPLQVNTEKLAKPCSATVGTSGKKVERVGAATPRIRNRPALTKGTAAGMTSQDTSSCPPTTSSVGPARYGTCTRSVFVRRLSSSTQKCVVVAVP